MRYYALTGQNKDIVGVIRYDGKRESTQIWRENGWVVNNSLYSYVMGDGGAMPITAAKAESIIKASRPKTPRKKK